MDLSVSSGSVDLSTTTATLDLLSISSAGSVSSDAALTVTDFNINGATASLTLTAGALVVNNA